MKKSSNNLKKGKIIVIEGTDGSGKKTQTNILLKKLQDAGYKIATLSFPQYGKKSAGLVEEYLNGKYGDAGKISPYAASLFYALDRFDVSFELKKLLSEGYTVLLDRYVDSNVGHQGGKIKDPAKRKKFIEWLYELEYGVLGIPKPDLVLILRVPAEIGFRLVAKKQQRLYLSGGKTHDAHEADMEHLKNAEAAYLWLAKQLPKDHKIIECVEGGRLLTPEAISDRVFSALKNII